MTECDWTLTLSFSDEEDGVRMRIRAKGGLACDSVTGPVPEYIVTDLTENVQYIRDASEVDGESPVQVYLGTDPSLPAVLLLENVRYIVEVEGDPDSVLDYLRDNDGVSLEGHRLAGGGRFFILSFRSYVGKGVLDATVGGRRVEIPFEVRSAKVGYLDDYPRMLSDIAEFSTTLLMHAKAPLYTCYDISDHSRETLYEDFMVLDYVFSKLDFEGAYRCVRENRHSELTARAERVPAGLASDVDAADLADLVRGDNLVPMDGGPVAGAYAPAEASETVWEDGFDTPENRLVKDLVLTMDRMVGNLRSSGAASKSGYVESRLSYMSDVLNGMASDGWLADVGDMRAVPLDSAILRSRQGYADLFRVHQILGLGAVFRQGDAEGLLKGQNKKLHLVYEYWCYTRLFKCLSEMAGSVQKFPVKRSDDDEWTLTIDTCCSRFIVPRGGSSLDVHLYYNKGFSEGSPEFRSYSVDLKPDFTLVIRSPTSPNRASIINFDAKYKSKPFSEKELDMESGGVRGRGESKPSSEEELDMEDDPRSDSWAYDICKMHTYRDALIHSCGSYILFPGGSGSYKEYRKPWNRQNWESRSDHFIPSIGTIPLTPGKNVDRLRDVLEKVLGGVAEISKGEINIEDQDLRDYLF